MDDLKRAQELGMTLDEFQRLVGHNPLDRHTGFLSAGYVSPSDNRKVDDKDDVKLKNDLKKKKTKDSDKSEAGHGKDAMPEIPSEYVPFETDDDVNNKVPNEMEHYWTRPVVSDEDRALYYGFHVHSKDNVYGLHAHYPGGPLGGGHRHTAQNPNGYHTHRYNQEELLQFKFARPGIMIQLDGPHYHQCSAPDGMHIHAEENFGPASSQRNKNVEQRNSKVDKTTVTMHPKREVDDLYDHN